MSNQRLGSKVAPGLTQQPPTSHPDSPESRDLKAAHTRTARLGREMADRGAPKIWPPRWVAYDVIVWYVLVLLLRMKFRCSRGGEMA
jgi:hypothetical protein